MAKKSFKNKTLPKGLLARKRFRKNKTVIYYYYNGRKDGKRIEIPLGKDYVTAIQQWAKLECNKIPKGTATFTMAANRYLTEVIALKESEETKKGAKYAIKNLLLFFGNPDAPLDEIEPQHIKEYYQWRKNVPHSANNEVGYFRAIFNCAREWGYTSQANPVSGVKGYKRAKRQIYIHDDLYQLVYDHAEQTLKDAMDLAYLTGQRPVDVVNIHSRQIKDGILFILQQKTKTKMRFEISGSLKTLLDRITPMSPNYLFRNKKGGVLSRKTLSNWFLKLRTELIAQYPEWKEELRNFQFRDLRAKSATDVYLKTDKETAREQLGHKNVSMTETYIRLPKTIKPIK